MGYLDFHHRRHSALLVCDHVNFTFTCIFYIVSCVVSRIPVSTVHPYREKGATDLEDGLVRCAQREISDLNTIEYQGLPFEESQAVVKRLLLKVEELLQILELKRELKSGRSCVCFEYWSAVKNILGILQIYFALSPALSPCRVIVDELPRDLVYKTSQLLTCIAALYSEPREPQQTHEERHATLKDALRRLPTLDFHSAKALETSQGIEYSED